MLFMRKAAFATVATLAVLAPLAAQAGTATSSVPVTATVANNCTISSPAAMAFGNYDPLVANASAALDVSANAISVACTNGVTATIGLDLGTNNPASTQTRRMKSGTSDYLTYDLFSDSARTTIWDATNTVSYTAVDTSAVSQTVYGRVAGGQNAPTGSYSDTITATVNF